ncbi:MAG TPA: cyclopropane-fatty-acyl-phospholipid synthase family protein [Acidobacteriota bacterium]|nr:cyclopropane-fatty-acyl-phospholipid synthase family protein [Acidobacteriota bacterium]
MSSQPDQTNFLESPTSSSPESSTSVTSAAPESFGLYQRIVIGVLEQMTRGCLNLEFPDGSTRTIGQPGAANSARIRILNPVFFKKCVLYGDIGFGEAYVDGDWDTDDITRVIAWAINNIDTIQVMSGSKGKSWLVNIFGFLNRVYHLMRPNSLRTSRRNIQEHYDLGNAFYQTFLDSTMTYSCAYFAASDQSLEAAQLAKYDALCRKLKLKATDHVLEIGTGWGGFSRYAAKTFGCRITTVTISEEQFKYAKALFDREGLADQIEIRLQDYRHIQGEFDKVVSIEMIEAVGDAFLETYFQKCQDVLKKDGLLALQMITCPDSRYELLRKGVDWIQKHIFPGSLLVSVGRVNQAINRTSDLYLHDLEDMGLFYARTLRLWRETFCQKLDQARALGFNDVFIRKWLYYLSYCEAAFAMRNISVVQVVYTRPNNPTLF